MNYLIIARSWFRAQPWPIQVWIAVCAAAGAALDVAQYDGGLSHVPVDIAMA